MSQKTLARIAAVSFASLAGCIAAPGTGDEAAADTVIPENEAGESVQALCTAPYAPSVTSFAGGGIYWHETSPSVPYPPNDGCESTDDTFRIKAISVSADGAYFSAAWPTGMFKPNTKAGCEASWVKVDAWRYSSSFGWQKMGTKQSNGVWNGITLTCTIPEAWTSTSIGALGSVTLQANGSAFNGQWQTKVNVDVGIESYIIK